MPSRQAITHPIGQYNSAVAQAFMILSFMSAGLLLSVQLVYRSQLTSQIGNSGSMAPVSSSSISLLPDPSPSASRTPATTSPFQVPQDPVPVADSPQDATVTPFATEIFQFLTGFSVFQHFTEKQPIEQEQTPSGGSATLIPPFLQTSVDKSQTVPPQNSQQATPLNQAAQTTMPDQSTEIALKQTTVQLVVDLSDRQLTLYEQDTVIDTYPIAVGKAGWETPVGEFVVTDKEPMPTWRHPLTGELVSAGEDSPLGTRWIGFWTDGIHQIGFHGTNQAQSIGQAISHGCIRLQNSDIESLYAKVSVGTPILVQP